MSLRSCLNERQNALKSNKPGPVDDFKNFATDLENSCTTASAHKSESSAGMEQLPHCCLAWHWFAMTQMVMKEQGIQRQTGRGVARRVPCQIGFSSPISYLHKSHDVPAPRLHPSAPGCPLLLPSILSKHHESVATVSKPIPIHH